MEDLGRRLRSAREARGISIATAESETKIRRKYLEALEEGRVVDLPGEVYLKGFLRTYGNFLGLDGPGMVKEYKAGREQPEEEAGMAAQGPKPLVQVVSRSRPDREAEGGVVRPAVDPGIPRVSPRPSLGRPRGQGRPFVMVLLVAGSVALVGYVGWLIALQLGRPVEPPPEVVTPAPPPVTTPVETTPPPVVPEPPPKQVVMVKGTGQDVIFTVPAKEFTVVMEITKAPVWVQAWVDEVRVLEATRTGTLEFKGSQMRIRVGHMIDVNLVVNGQRFEAPLGKDPYWLIFKAEP